MIVDKIKNEEGNYVPNVPAHLKLKKATYLSDIDKYEIEYAELNTLNEITALQGEQYLDSITINGKNGLEVVMEMVATQPLIVRRFFDKAQIWRKDTKAVQDICTALGLNIDTVFTEAKKFERYLK